MDSRISYGSDQYNQSEDDMDVRKGPWTSEEDEILSHYIAMHGEGRWNAAARSSGLKRTGKSCRLRWLNYLRPNVRRGNISLQEQLLILELHSRWGNRWSKIAQHLPGRTDNEIKNYWRTRVQKQAKQLKCDVNSKQFRDAMRYVWMPRIMEQIKASESNSDQSNFSSANNQAEYSDLSNQIVSSNEAGLNWSEPSLMPELSGSCSDSLDSQVSGNAMSSGLNEAPSEYYSDGMQSGSGRNDEGGLWDWYGQQGSIAGGGESLESFWNDDNILFLQQQLL